MCENRNHSCQRVGLYQSSHLSMQEYAFASELAKNKDRDKIEALIRQGDESYLNAFRLLGELGPEAPSLITSFVDKECSMTRVKLLMALHQVHPQLANVDLGKSYARKRTEWARFCLFSCGCACMRACVQVQVCAQYPIPSWMCVCVCKAYHVRLRTSKLVTPQVPCLCYCLCSFSRAKPT